MAPVGNPSATPTLPDAVWLSLTSKDAPALFDNTVVRYVSLLVAKLRLKLKAFSLPLAVRNTGTVTVPPEATLLLPTRSADGPGLIVRTALLLTANPPEFVIATEYSPAFDD